MGSRCSKDSGAEHDHIQENSATLAYFDNLASETPFTASEIQSLHELYEKLSSSMIKDGFIHKEELQLALFKNSRKRNLFLDRTFKEADAKGDGRIDEEEWKDYVTKNPSLLKNMTLPYLMDINQAFPSFVLRGEGAEDCKQRS